MTHRSRALLDLAHSAPCFADFPHECNGWQGCVPAHSDSHIFGRGIGHKSSDWAFAMVCSNAHAVITAKVSDPVARDQKFFDWLRSFAKTQEYLWTNKKIRLA